MNPELKKALLFLGGTAATAATIQVAKEIIDVVQHADAVTLPVGVLYFTNPPTTEMIAHETCHRERLKEIGAFRFYWDYFTGGVAMEELRCSFPWLLGGK